MFQSHCHRYIKSSTWLWALPLETFLKEWIDLKWVVLLQSKVFRNHLQQQFGLWHIPIKPILGPVMSPKQLRVWTQSTLRASCSIWHQFLIWWRSKVFVIFVDVFLSCFWSVSECMSCQRRLLSLGRWAWSVKMFRWVVHVVGTSTWMQRPNKL